MPFNSIYGKQLGLLMKEILEIVLIIGIWLFLSRFLLPKLGVPT